MPTKRLARTAARRFQSRNAYVRWLFEFLRVDLTTTTAGQTLDWQRDAKDFLDLGEGSIIDLSPEGGLAAHDDLPTLSLLSTLQQELRTGIDRLWRDDGGWASPPIGAELVRFRGRFDDNGWIRWTGRRGSFRSLFLNAMQRLVVESWPRLRKCPRCTQWFVKVRKQEYCSPICSQKTRWARFVAAHPPRDHHRKHERAVKKKLHAKVKVRRSRTDAHGKR